jgi:hypothetical protein
MSTGRMRQSENGNPEGNILVTDNSRYAGAKSVGGASSAAPRKGSVPPLPQDAIQASSLAGSATPVPRSQSAGKSRLKQPIHSSDSNHTKPASKGMSNYQQVKNALTNVFLAGPLSAGERDDAFKTMDMHFSGQSSLLEVRYFARNVVLVTNCWCQVRHNVAVSQFIILCFQSKSLSYRGIYGVDSQTGDVVRIVGKGPRILPEQLIEQYLKYESSSRSFKPLPTKSLTATTDAVSIDPAKLKKLLHPS